MGGHVFCDVLRVGERLLVVREPVQNALPHDRHDDLQLVDLTEVSPQHVFWMIDGQPRPLFGGPGRDRLIGGGASDLLIGGGGSDSIVGGGSSDLLLGGGGADRLIGGGGRDSCRGAGGVDTAKGCELTRGIP